MIRSMKPDFKNINIKAAAPAGALCGCKTKAGADIVVLCSSDDEYAEYGPAAFKAVGDSAIFVIAGNPACIEDLKAVGIENYVHVRCNVLETLRDFNSKLNIK